LNYTREEGVF